MKYLPITLDVNDILCADGFELQTLINKAITDMVADLRNQYKKAADPRKITIELSLVNLDGNNVGVDFKVTPKAAAYTQMPEQDDKRVPDGQMSIGDYLTGEVSEEEAEAAMLAADAEENKARLDNLLGKKKKRA